MSKERTGDKEGGTSDSVDWGMGGMRLTEHLRFIYGLSEGLMVYFTGRKQDLRPA